VGRGIKFCRFSIFYGAVKYLILDRTREIQEFGGRSLSQVERPFLVLVVEARGTDAEVAGHSQKWMTAGRRVLASFRFRGNIFATSAESKTEAGLLLCRWDLTI
jgi:hypothetical protein